MEFLRYNYEGQLPNVLSSIQNMIISRREIINNAQNKLDQALKEIIEYSRIKKSLCFLSSIEKCEEFENKLKEARVNAFSIHSNKSKDDNHQALSAFKRADKGCLIAVRKLDEGIDIKDAEVAFNVSYHNTMLQLVQRTGRIIRKHPDKKPLFIHYVVDVDLGSQYIIDRINNLIKGRSLPDINENIATEVMEPVHTNIINQDRNRIQKQLPTTNEDNKTNQANNGQSNLNISSFRCPKCNAEFVNFEEAKIHFNQKRCNHK